MIPVDDLIQAHDWGSLWWTGEGWHFNDHEECPLCDGTGEIFDPFANRFETCVRCKGEGEARPAPGYPDPRCKCLNCERERRSI